MSVDYNNFASTFSKSRENMKWEEIDYFLGFLWKENLNWISVLDVGCWNGRLLAHLEKIEASHLVPLNKGENLSKNEGRGISIANYLWIDASSWLIDEAKKLHLNHKFEVLDMLSISDIEDTFDCIFFIASFHHLHTIEERIDVLKEAKKLLNPNWTIFMTNWALNSELNTEKYKNSIIENSKNEFWSQDYNIKIGKFTRFYHSFSLEELEYLFKEAWFEIVENRLFNNGRNWVSVLK